jgi:hypothetical protein
MENQHKKITGYRDLSQAEIDLMNRVKAHAEATAALLQEVSDLRGDVSLPTDLDLDQQQESGRCLALAKTNLQTGQMWFVRAIALPNSF